jgi:hypothetical protein
MISNDTVANKDNIDLIMEEIREDRARIEEEIKTKIFYVCNECDDITKHSITAKTFRSAIYKAKQKAKDTYSKVLIYNKDMGLISAVAKSNGMVSDIYVGLEAYKLKRKTLYGIEI